ncbi:MAG: hypothetical protein FWF15_08255, partial [Oscillospiraceae bacterium]|nr:hypothetical protein [Oscillospiraceae bacterium]
MQLGATHSEERFHYGSIRVNLQRKGTLIGQMDLLIAAHARTCKLIVVINNVREFTRVEGLTIEDWTVSLYNTSSRICVVKVSMSNFQRKLQGNKIKSTIIMT